jgi:hypothetical protein
MAPNEVPISTPSAKELWAHCEHLGQAVNNGDVGQTVTAVQHLILRYYDNVREQATESFKSAKRIALFGFVLLVLTIAYVIFIDLMLHRPGSGFVASSGTMSVGQIGLVGSSIVEAIAGLQFYLYGRATRQFGAFHICLERTHRYLLAYKIAEQMNSGKDDALQKIVCIMANAPMITRQDIEGVESTRMKTPSTAPSSALSAAAGTS